MDDKLKATIDKIIALTESNSEFNEELRKRLKITSSANSVYIEDDRIYQIYEYCIEKIVKKQAEDFYNDFPIKSIKSTLIEDFCRMEAFRRKDNFGDFCLAVYQQIENITNKLCTNPKLEEITSKMWKSLAYIKSGEDIAPNISVRTGNITIRQLLFGKEINSKSHIAFCIEKTASPIQSLYAMDKIRTIVYFIGYGTCFRNSDFNNFIEITSLLNDIYQCRNMNHRGNVLHAYEEATINRVNSLKSFYYFKFIAAFTQYVEFVKTGWSKIDDILEYSKTINSEELPKEVFNSLKILGKIDLKDNKRRFK